MMSLFNKLILLFLPVFFVVGLGKIHAQNDARTHFIYIQSDNQQPFYVILNRKSYSSSSVGYLIISKLVDGNYNITVGFPKDEFPAQTYALQINGNDAGFSLKKGTGKTWDLVDKLSQQSLAVVNTDANPTDVAAATPGTSNGKAGFGDMLSKTSTDTTNYDAYIQPKAPAKKEVAATAAAEMPQAAKPITKGDTSASGTGIGDIAKNERKRTEAPLQQRTPEAVKNDADAEANESLDAAAARSATESIVKIDERSDRRGVSMAFVVSQGEKIDTINTFFPGDSKNSVTETDGTEDGAVAAKSPKVSPEKEALKKEVDSRQPATDNPFYKGPATTGKNTGAGDLSLFGDSDTQAANDAASRATAGKKKITESATDDMEGKPQAATKEIFNSTCSNMLTDKDVEKIRKKMIAKSSDEEMIAVARKAIDTRCVYTAQVKELGGLLISDHGRLALYRILYPNVYDGSQFPVLEDQLLDKNYKLQFESLIRNR